MRLALEEADRAASHGDVPVGAVVVDQAGHELARGRNRRELDRDPTAHAEVLALRSAARALDRWRLSGCTLYVTVEPCAMCAGALVSARIDRLVYGCADAKAGAIDSLFVLGRDPRLNHRFAVSAGVLAAACRARLQSFFEGRRET